jgi:SAM-dependent methyltransferase
MSGTPPVHEAAQRRDWVAYFDRIEGKPPRETVVRALDLFGEIEDGDSARCVDLGCGSGRDIEAMLTRGWRVLGCDGSAEGLARARQREANAAALGDGRLELVQADFGSVEIPRTRWVNASFALPFCPPAEWEHLWSKIDGAIERGGRFSGQFFGDRDDWAILEDRTHLTRVETLGLFDQYILEWFQEEDRASSHVGEAHKHWHVFHVIARKREGSR